ncbi:outer membrane lipoprotein chaperone LolA [Paraferrimonas sedimenticola]|uniref:Outer-membrane lipoprotein carrier protein n=1 Tax=Paraferrimonas sedimenticola TaxID=375674 RepID=A0AA37W2A3_9GAMM|nr:outer membrane lipoprotein chaperone LolA [Paraferrimonas sedimenticola]GLP97840.1 outer-membrane lipoprotein carrier protein [Paraferrimonas sedimenticola]
MKKLILTGLAITGLSTSALADDASRDALQAQMQANAEFTSTFEQKVTDVNGQLLQQGKGTLSIAIPNRFNWHATEPDESLIVADGTDLWVYNPFIEQVSVMTLTQAMQASPMALLVQSDSSAWQDYQVEQQGQCYQIQPKPELLSGANPSLLRNAQACFEGDNLASLELLDAQGNTTLFSLSAHQSTVDPQLFVFELPEGVDLDDQRP